MNTKCMAFADTSFLAARGASDGDDRVYFCHCGPDNYEMISGFGIWAYISNQGWRGRFEPNRIYALVKVCDDDLRPAVAGRQHFAATAPVSLLIAADVSDPVYTGARSTLSNRESMLQWECSGTFNGDAPFVKNVAIINDCGEMIIEKFEM